MNPITKAAQLAREIDSTELVIVQACLSGMFNEPDLATTFATLKARQGRQRAELKALEDQYEPRP